MPRVLKARRLPPQPPCESLKFYSETLHAKALLRVGYNKTNVGIITGMVQQASSCMGHCCYVAWPVPRQLRHLCLPAPPQAGQRVTRRTRGGPSTPGSGGCHARPPRPPQRLHATLPPLPPSQHAHRSPGAARRETADASRTHCTPPTYAAPITCTRKASRRRAEGGQAVHRRARPYSSQQKRPVACSKSTRPLPARLGGWAAVSIWNLRCDVHAARGHAQGTRRAATGCTRTLAAPVLQRCVRRSAGAICPRPRSHGSLARFIGQRLEAPSAGAARRL